MSHRINPVAARHAMGHVGAPDLEAAFPFDGAGEDVEGLAVAAADVAAGDAEQLAAMGAAGILGRGTEAAAGTGPR